MFWFGLACFPENHANCWGAVSMFFFRPSVVVVVVVVVFVGRRRRIFFEVLFFKIISKNLPLKGKFFEMVSRALPPGGSGGLGPPGISVNYPCLASAAAVPCPRALPPIFFRPKFFRRNFFVGIFSSEFFRRNFFCRNFLV